MQTSPSEIYRHVQLLPESPQQITDQLRERGLHRDAFCIVGGEKNQSRDRGVAHLARSDDAWFDFSIVVRQGGDQLELLSMFIDGTRLPAARAKRGLTAFEVSWFEATRALHRR